MTQKQAILTALAKGKKITTLDAVRDFGTVKAPTRIGELEKKYNFSCVRTLKKFKTRYGTDGYFFEYQVRPADRKKLLKIVSKQK